MSQKYLFLWTALLIQYACLQVSYFFINSKLPVRMLKKKKKYFKYLFKNMSTIFPSELDSLFTALSVNFIRIRSSSCF